jgi:hypothetical protein
VSETELLANLRVDWKGLTHGFEFILHRSDRLAMPLSAEEPGQSVADGHHDALELSRCRCLVERRQSSTSEVRGRWQRPG